MARNPAKLYDHGRSNAPSCYFTPYVKIESQLYGYERTGHVYIYMIR